VRQRWRGGQACLEHAFRGFLNSCTVSPKIPIQQPTNHLWINHVQYRSQPTSTKDRWDAWQYSRLLSILSQYCTELGTKLLHFTLLYFTHTLPALPNVTRSHDRRHLPRLKFKLVEGYHTWTTHTTNSHNHANAATSTPTAAIVLCSTALPLSRSSHSGVVLDHYPYCRRCNTTVDYCTVSRQQQHVMCGRCWAYLRHRRFWRRLLQPSTAASATSPASESTTEKLELDGSFAWGDEMALHVRAAMRAAAIIWIWILTMIRRLVRRPIHKIFHINLTQQSNGQ
jgi:hypothetical protein